MFSLVQNYLQSLWTSLYATLFSPHRRPARLLVLGLDNAGKTTLLQALRRQPHHESSSSSQSHSQQRSYPPTDRPEHLRDIVTIGNISFSAYDLGGHEAVRHLWSDYYHDDSDESPNDEAAQSLPGLAILFCIDASDPERLDEAAYELDALLHDDDEVAHGRRRRKSMPLAILLTKCDSLHTSCDDGMTTSVPLLTNDEVSQHIELPILQQQCPGRVRLFRISVYEQKGYMEALQWIASVV